MLQIVGALILLIAGFAILRLLFRALISTASALAGLILLCLFGPALLAGYITERITRLFHIRWLAGVFLTIAGMIISLMWGLDGKHIALEAHTFDSVKFILTTALAGGLLAVLPSVWDERPAHGRVHCGERPAGGQPGHCDGGGLWGR